MRYVRVTKMCLSCIYTTGKKYGIFFILAIFCIFVEYAGCFCIWNNFYEQILLWGGGGGS